MDVLTKLRQRYLWQPHEVSLETFALCNAACTFCPYPTLDRQGEKMSDALLDKLVGEMAQWTQPFMFSPFKVNEPLLDARLIPLCERMNRETRAVLRIFTNGSALTPEKIAGIAGLRNVAHLWVSLNSHDPVEYEQLMALKFKQTAKRLDYLHGAGFPHDVVLSTVGSPNEAFRSYCAERWPRFECVIIEKSGWLGYTQAAVEEVPDTPCLRWFELSIMANGIVSLCCMDGVGEYAIGDVNQQTMLQVYNAPAYRERRDKLLSRRAVKPCDQCTY